MSKVTITTKAGVTKEVDNTNSGAVFPYSDKEMIGPFQFEAPDKDLTLRLGKPDDKGRMHLSVTKLDQVLAKGFVRVQDMTRPTKTGRPGPNVRGSMMIVATGEVIPMTGWKKTEDTGREMLQIREDNRGNTGSCFI